MLERNAQVEEIFSVASQQFISGRSLESAVADYPEHETEIEPLLRIAHALRSIPTPLLAEESMQRINQRVQIAVREKNLESPAPTLTLVRSDGKTNQEARSQFAAGSGSSDKRPRALLSSGRSWAILVVTVAVLLLMGLFAILAWYNSTDAHRLETYDGKIVRLTDHGWIVGDTEIYVDQYTEIHGFPVVGAEVTCVAEPFPPGDRMRALEVWVRSATPATPGRVPTVPPDSSVSPPDLIGYETRHNTNEVRSLHRSNSTTATYYL